MDDIFHPMGDNDAGWPLPPRLAAVAGQMVLGRSDKEVAAVCSLTVASARTYAKRVLARLGLRSRLEMLLWAMEHGLVVARFPPVACAGQCPLRLSVPCHQGAPPSLVGERGSPDGVGSLVGVVRSTSGRSRLPR